MFTVANGDERAREAVATAQAETTSGKAVVLSQTV